jgi:glycosyltransferase involved in cell wall biosynthesis
LKNALASWTNRTSLQIFIAPDGVDLERYQDLRSPEESRQSLPPAFRFSPSAFVAGYSGHLYSGRGVQLILDIAANLPEVTFLLVGGEPEDVVHLRAESQKRSLNNIFLTGFIPNADLPLYQASCDILLMPYQKRVAASSGGDIANYLSPMKVFEYLACGRVILSSDLPVLREVLNDRNSLLLPPDDPAVWVAAIRNLRSNPQLRQALSAQAIKDAQQYSWETRAAKILTLVG